MTPDLSFICVADRPDALRQLIACLRLQSDPRWELIVLDQTSRGACVLPIVEAEKLGETRLVYEPVPRVGDIGQSMKLAYSRYARGEFLCFPHDDAYYMPPFVDRMLMTARDGQLDLVYCDWIFDRANNTVPYHYWPGSPVFGRIDIGGFIVRKTVIVGGAWHDSIEGWDGRMVERICATHPHGCVPDNRVLYVKN